MSNVISLAERRASAAPAAPAPTDTDMRPRVTRIIHRKSPDESYLLGEIGPTAERLSMVDFFAYDEPEPPRYA